MSNGVSLKPRSQANLDVSVVFSLLSPCPKDPKTGARRTPPRAGRGRG